MLHLCHRVSQRSRRGLRCTREWVGQAGGRSGRRPFRGRLWLLFLGQRVWRDQKIEQRILRRLPGQFGESMMGMRALCYWRKGLGVVGDVVVQPGEDGAGFVGEIRKGCCQIEGELLK